MQQSAYSDDKVMFCFCFVCSSPPTALSIPHCMIVQQLSVAEGRSEVPELLPKAPLLMLEISDVGSEDRHLPF